MHKKIKSLAAPTHHRNQTLEAPRTAEELSMAELTESLVREFVRHNSQNRNAPYTRWEFHQLCAAWFRLNGLPVPNFVPFVSDAATESGK
jgi:hypothetical protein